jgi:hypothetical protein
MCLVSAALSAGEVLGSGAYWLDLVTVTWFLPCMWQMLGFCGGRMGELL